MLYKDNIVNYFIFFAAWFTNKEYVITPQHIIQKAQQQTIIVVFSALMTQVKI